MQSSIHPCDAPQEYLGNNDEYHIYIWAIYAAVLISFIKRGENNF